MNKRIMIGTICSTLTLTVNILTSRLTLWQSLCIIAVRRCRWIMVRFRAATLTFPFGLIISDMMPTL